MLLAFPLANLPAPLNDVMFCLHQEKITFISINIDFYLCRIDQGCQGKYIEIYCTGREY
jgi:hypothetical protein